MVGDAESTKKVKTAIEYACGESKITQFLTWVTKSSKKRNAIDIVILTNENELAKIREETKSVHLLLCLSMATKIESRDVWGPIVKSTLPSNIKMKTIILWTEKKEYQKLREIEETLDSDVKNIFDNSVKYFHKKENTLFIFVASVCLATVFRVRNFQAARISPIVK